MATDVPPRTAPPALGGAVRVTPMRRRHLRQVVAIEKATYARPWPLATFAAELDKPHRRYLVARHGRRVVVGYGGALLQATDVHITTVAVDPRVQGRGVAGRLVLELLLAARALTTDGGATLEVRAGNAVAQRLYAGFGFAVEGRRPRYYPDDGEDALVLWLRDLHGPAVTRTLRERAAALDLALPRDLTPPRRPRD